MEEAEGKQYPYKYTLEEYIYHVIFILFAISSMLTTLHYTTLTTETQKYSL